MLNAVALAENPLGHFHVQIKKIENSRTDQLYDIWNGSRFLLNRNMFPEKLDNLNGKILKYVILISFCQAKPNPSSSFA